MWLWFWIYLLRWCVVVCRCGQGGLFRVGCLLQGLEIGSGPWLGFGHGRCNLILFFCFFVVCFYWFFSFILSDPTGRVVLHHYVCRSVMTLSAKCLSRYLLIRRTGWLEHISFLCGCWAIVLLVCQCLVYQSIWPVVGYESTMASTVAVTTFPASWCIGDILVLFDPLDCEDMSGSSVVSLYYK